MLYCVWIMTYVLRGTYEEGWLCTCKGLRVRFDYLLAWVTPVFRIYDYRFQMCYYEWGMDSLTRKLLVITSLVLIARSLSCAL